MTTIETTSSLLNCDVCVAGGGPAGVPAAIAAARNGAKVILCQDRPVLGGNASSEIRMHIVGADGSGKRGSALATETREGGIIEEIRLENAIHNPQRSASMMDFILFDMCQREPNLTLMLNTCVTAAQVESGVIRSVTAERQSTEDIFQIHAKVFIDCTGDGRLGLEAGAEFREGRESKAEFGESMAQDAHDDKRLGSSLLFQARKHDKPMPFTAPSWAKRFTERELHLRNHAAAGDTDCGFDYGYWWIEWGGCFDTIKDNEMIRDKLLAILMGAWDHVKNGDPTDPNYPNPDSHGASHWALDWFGFVPGKRESRRFKGLHTITELDVMAGSAFSDAIAYGGWPIDTHPPEGTDAIDERPAVQHEVPYLFDIPLSACVSCNVPNLMFAGRNISATHLGFAATRVMATCAVMGQGVGVAAAYAVQQNQQPNTLPQNTVAMRAIQQELLREDAYLIDPLNDDPRDLARSAKLSASSEQPEGKAENVLSGQTRATHGPKGVAPQRMRSGVHRWMSDPAKGLPASLELSWEHAVNIGEVQLIFDTGLHRVLTLSMSGGYTNLMQWGQPQEETVAAYKIEVERDGVWQTFAEVEGNYLRRRCHTAEEVVSSSRLRLTVLATHGLDHARLCEIRVYPEPAPGFLQSAGTEA
ncbi:FAD-dependent oxidoreductase [Coraliomargarita sp. SDUM461003]|uniref:FAD-dependent oxidoreductase n=1 Tax=Thalassobacterium maritimum TaxID=3041265 RepID=A0ABU1AYX5_9BACT|nr:FAD-dependent oxidoreductase [Coraliomargarita sp. SDUM461003]MDQ8208325.1 FAD-dependent oxidoreductase [Coraliomargarita sp. SDUM461003]